MAKIEQFESPVDKLTPSEQGEEAYVRAGRLSGQFWHQLGQAGDQLVKGYQETVGNREVSQGIPLLQGAYAASIQRLNQRLTDPKTDPNDPTLIAQVGQEFTDNLQGFEQHFTSPKGQEYFRAESARLTSEFMTTARAAQGHMAYVAAGRNIDAAVAINGTLATQDHSQLGVALTGIDQAFAHANEVGGTVMSPEESAQLALHRDEVKRQVAVASYKSFMLQGGQQAIDATRKDMLDPGAGGGVLGAAEREELGGFADTQERLLKEQARAEKSDNLRDQKVAFDKGLSDFYGSMIGKDGLMHPTADSASRLRQLAAMPGAEGAAIHAASDAIAVAREQDESGASWSDDYKTVQAFDARVGVTGTDALTHQEVDRAFASKLLSRATYERLTQSVEHAASDPAYGHALTELDQYLEQAKGLFGISDQMGVSPVNTRRMAAYLQWRSDNRRLFDLHIQNDHLTPEASVAAMSDQGNRMNTTRQIGEYIKRADAASDVAGLNASFLNNPVPLTLDAVARTNPGAAGAEQATRAAAAAKAHGTGSAAGLTADQIAWAKAHGAK